MKERKKERILAKNQKIEEKGHGIKRKKERKKEKASIGSRKEYTIDISKVRNI